MIGDIGGTNARFQLFSLDRLTHEYSLMQNCTYLTNDYQSLKEVLFLFLKLTELEKEAILYGCVAIAGIVRDNSFMGASHICWKPFSSKEFTQDKWFTEFSIINDFQAVGNSSELFVDKNLYQLNDQAVQM